MYLLVNLLTKLPCCRAGKQWPIYAKWRPWQSLNSRDFE